MPDEADRAAERTDAWNERCLGAVTRQMQQPGAIECETCGEPIPARRREALPSATRCAPCQEALEKRRAR